jgi:hypothetical protein
MNEIEIKSDKLVVGLSEIRMMITPVLEARFQQDVFPHLFDGQTTGSRGVEGDRIKYVLLVRNSILVEMLKRKLVNAVMMANGQLN